jgi:hypothetical protein
MMNFIKKKFGTPLKIMDREGFLNPVRPDNIIYAADSEAF